MDDKLPIKLIFLAVTGFFFNFAVHLIAKAIRDIFILKIKKCFLTMTNRKHHLPYHLFSSSFPILIACMAFILSSCQSKTADEYYDEGYSFALKSDYDSAIINYEKAIKKDKKFTKAMIALGNVYQNLKQKDLSLSYYDMALEIDSTLADAYYGRGMLKRNSGDEYGACSDFVEADYYGRPYMQDYLKRCFNLYQVTPKHKKEPWEE